MPDIVLASKSKVRKTILEKNEISCTVKPSNVDEAVKIGLFKEGASPEIISKNLAELKANRSAKNGSEFSLGADA